MNRRNYLQLNRKLIDSVDLTYSFDAVQAYNAANNLAFFGEGVLVTTTYPAPFPIALSGFSGTVGNGIAYDPTGLQTRIDDAAGSFAIAAADSANTRMDLIVLRYISVGDTLVPEPSLPTSEVYLNLHDGYQVAVVAGTPSTTPVYPAKGPYDIILAGAITAANGTPRLDLSVREIATPLRAFYPTFKQEPLTGTVDGTNTAFTLSAVPYDSSSVIVSVSGLAQPQSSYTLTGQTITFASAPAPGQKIAAFYVVNSAGSVNPVSGHQEVPTGIIDGANNTFTLSAEPVDQNSLQVYIDGLHVPVTGWSLSQNPTASQILFNAGWIPQPGQDVYAFYLKNVVSSSGTVSAATTTTSSASSTSSGTFTAEYPQLSSNDISNGYVTLAHTPLTPAAVMLDIIGDGAQVYLSDFTVSGAQLTWSSSLASLLAAGDQFRVFYAY